MKNRKMSKIDSRTFEISSIFNDENVNHNYPKLAKFEKLMSPKLLKFKILFD